MKMPRIMTTTVHALSDEVLRARRKFPSSEHRFHALSEEVGELSKACLQSGSLSLRAREEAIQVATTAVRIYEEGDSSGESHHRECLAPIEGKTISLVDDEVVRSRTKFPGNGRMLWALSEEVGEVARAFIDHGPNSDSAKTEAIQVAATALRIYEEGDASTYAPAEAPASEEQTSKREAMEWHAWGRRSADRDPYIYGVCFVPRGELPDHDGDSGSLMRIPSLDFRAEAPQSPSKPGHNSVLPWPEGASVSCNDGPQSEITFRVGGLDIRVSPNGVVGPHWQKSSYTVECLECANILHTGTQMPSRVIRQHMMEIHRFHEVILHTSDHRYGCGVYAVGNNALAWKQSDCDCGAWSNQ